MPRILTYNVHRCLGGDRKLSPARIAEVIASQNADIVALQEVDIGRKRSGRVDQADVIARELGMRIHFHSALRVMEEKYGDAILTPHPSREIHSGMLPNAIRRPNLERRGALWAEVEIGGHRLQVINTHLGLLAHERRAQIDALFGVEWLDHPDCADPLILTGDMNAVPRSRAYRRLAARLTDAQRVNGASARPQPTFPALMPLLRLDHVMVSRSIRVTRAEVVRTAVSRLASDHLPLVVDFEIERHAGHRRRG